jgi:RNA polymerase sigma factor (sigma-70 family)
MQTVSAPLENATVVGSMEIGSIHRPALESCASETAFSHPALEIGAEVAIDGSDWQSITLRAYEELNVALCRYLLALGLTVDAAEDVAQETFLRLARCLRAGSKIDNKQAWIFQVAHNLSMDIHRAHRRSRVEFAMEGEPQQERADPNANPEWVYLQKEKASQLRVAMGRLTPRQFRSVLLRGEGLRYREIALVLGVSEQRAIHLVKRALVRLVETQ